MGWWRERGRGRRGMSGHAVQGTRGALAPWHLTPVITQPSSSLGSSRQPRHSRQPRRPSESPTVSEQLRLGHTRVAHEADVDVAAQLHAVVQHLVHAAHHGQQQRLLHVLVAVDLCWRVRPEQRGVQGREPDSLRPWRVRLLGNPAHACKGAPAGPPPPLLPPAPSTARMAAPPRPLSLAARTACTHPARWSWRAASRCPPPPSSPRWRPVALQTAPAPGSSACSA